MLESGPGGALLGRAGADDGLATVSDRGKSLEDGAPGSVEAAGGGPDAGSDGGGAGGRSAAGGDVDGVGDRFVDSGSIEGDGRGGELGLSRGAV
jgi:hypothetical protein